MSPVRGMVLKLSAVLLFVIMASLIKASADVVPPGEAVFFRSFFALPVILGWLALRHELATGLRTRNPMGHLWRGMFGVSAMGCGFAALGLLPLPEVTVLGYAAPILTVIFAAILLGERIRLIRISAVIMGLVGVVIVMLPQLGNEDLGTAARWGVGLVLASATLRALAHVHIRKLVQHETTSAVVFYFAVTASCFALLTAPFGWVVPDPVTAAQLVGAGLVGGVAQILLTSSYRHAEAAFLAPFDYASILFALVIGYTIFDEIPTSQTVIGSVVIIAAGVLIIWRERQLGMKRGPARSNLTPQG
ncbi:DMT family transporter [Marivita hallyeonensis]|uniref:Permease of the drug/metabolite transporter (DMT) superfamily n=1 Tax=Marivita hallyeonensis TaxID=996342 RepID=A0A1M5TAL9_9RHOB|nr:DMT family transporter [Marivita hallyeonensis]SHH47728.1 Permease of the drug/metabolite transporter (DMT) superfamily [Marivita hallyeonensis]